MMYNISDEQRCTSKEVPRGTCELFTLVLF